MNKALKRITSILTAFILIFTAAAAFSPDANASTGSQKYWMKKALKAYEAGNMKSARKYNKKLTKYAKEKCVSKMTRKQKNAYYNKLQKWPLENSDGNTPYIWDYFLTDYNDDGKADLIAEIGTCEADVRYKVYTYRNGKLKYLGSFGAGHSVLFRNATGKGVIKGTYHMGYEILSKVYRRSGKNVTRDIRSRETNNYFLLRNRLKSHSKYDDDYNHYLTYDEL